MSSQKRWFRYIAFLYTGWGLDDLIQVPHDKAGGVLYLLFAGIFVGASFLFKDGAK